MAKGETTSGLLSKVARFVRNPTSPWSQRDLQEPEPDSGYSKEALKEMIERKRQNDFVRKREFDHLRKLRRREPRLGSAQVGRPSFFHSSLPSNLDERAETLKKIDEIEAQMSRQWWKGRQEEPSARTSGCPDAAARPVPDVGPDTPSVSASAFPGSGLEDGQSPQTDVAALRLNSGWLDSSAQFASTQMSPSLSLPGTLPREYPLSPPGGRPAPVGAGFASSRLFAVEPPASPTDPDLEEAAIRFANGDDGGAESGLLHALQGEKLRPEQAQAWMAALFDLYRATGQQGRFDSVAIDFANRFGRSAPAWFSTPDLLGRKADQALAATGKPRAPAQQPTWSCPAELTLAALAELNASLQHSAQPWQLDWRALESIAPDALEGLGQLLAGWCATPVRLVFGGHDQLDRALRALTPAGDRRVSPACWQLRMDALRVMQRPDEFERVAIEYCVVFEVSPPSWQEARCCCELEGLGAGPAAGAPGETAGPGPHGAPAPAAQAELTGEMRGDAADRLRQLEASQDGASRLVISCARLIRVDFAAAGSILSWVAAQQEKGCQVQFRDVNRMVAAFFNVIGISEQAQVVPRST